MGEVPKSKIGFKGKGKSTTDKILALLKGKSYRDAKMDLELALGALESRAIVGQQ